MKNIFLELKKTQNNYEKESYKAQTSKTRVDKVE